MQTFKNIEKIKRTEKPLKSRNFIPVNYRVLRDNITRLGIAGKLMMSFLSLLILLFAVSTYALVDLNRLNQINSSMLNSDIPIINSCNKMIDLILSQEQYARRQIIYKDPDVDKLFWEKDEELKNNIKLIKQLNKSNTGIISRFESIHQKYTKLLTLQLPIATNNAQIDADQIKTEIKNTQKELIKNIKFIANRANEDLHRKAGVLSSIGSVAYHSAVILFAIGVVFSIVLSITITRNIGGGIKKLKKATELISEGKFDDLPVVNNKDELGELSSAFMHMSQRLKELEELNLHASPLTKIPGGIAVEEDLKNRIKVKKQIAFCLIDIDNFKSYNDCYGYAKGNIIIKKTAEIIQEATNKCGTEDDFVGHIGGDDFVVITETDNCRDICELIINKFDHMIPCYYSTQACEIGYIKTRSRQGVVEEHPLASISIAVVTNLNKTMESHLEYGEIAAELKEYLKSLPGSNYIIDRRKNNSINQTPDRSNIISIFQNSKAYVK